MNTKPLIDRELTRFLHGGLSLTVATRDSDLHPNGAPCWAVRVHEEGMRVTVFLHEVSGREMLKNLEVHPEMAVLCERPSDHRGCQLKGMYLSWRATREDEHAEIERQIDGFMTELETIGIPRELFAGWELWPSIALDMRVTQKFDQTPGPGAGEPLR